MTDIPRQTDSVLYESYILRQPFLAGKTKNTIGNGRNMLVFFMENRKHI